MKRKRNDNFREPVANSQGIGKSRKEDRKMKKKLKKMGRIAFTNKRKVEDVIRENFGGKNPMKQGKVEVREAELSDDETIHEQKRGRKKQKLEESDTDEEDITYEEYLRQVEKKKKQISLEGSSKDDDLAIHRYSRLLGLKGGNDAIKTKSKVPKAFRNDGLDILLEFCDAENRDELVAMEKEIEEDEIEGDSTDSEVDDAKQTLAEEVDLSEGESGEDEEELTEDGEHLNEEESEESEDSEAPAGSSKDAEIVQDIYGRNINKKTRELIEFNPTAARQKLAELEERTETDESRVQTERTLTGLVNRLAEATLVKSKQQIAELWRSQSKNVIKQSLQRILSRIIGSPFRVQNQLLCVYASFLALLHSTVDQDITAHFVELFICDFVKSLENEAQNEDDKARENKAILLANLFNFKIIGYQMILDVVDRFSRDLNIEKLHTILVILSNCHCQLKKRCAQQFQDRITKILADYEKAPFSAIPRSKFIAEQLGALKKQPPAAVDFDEIDRMAKIVTAICKREKGGSEKELGMSLEDLLMAEQRGRWWVVGSAFRLPSDSYNELANREKKGKAPMLQQFPKEMLALAEKVGMKTEIRKQIFCLIGSSEDEDEAFERLLRLSLKGQQERELVYVPTTMGLKEKRFNPFYPSLLARFCNYHRRFNLTVQFAVWDRWKEAASLSGRGHANLAALIHFLLVRNVQPVTLLKVVEWGLLDAAQSVTLLKLFNLLNETPKNVLKKIFAPLFDEKKASKLSLLLEGMRVWLEIHMKGCAVLETIDEIAGSGQS